jgi:hypothetical protein
MQQDIYFKDFNFSSILNFLGVTAAEDVIKGNKGQVIIATDDHYDTS